MSVQDILWLIRTTVLMHRESCKIYRNRVKVTDIIMWMLSVAAKQGLLLAEVMDSSKTWYMHAEQPSEEPCQVLVTLSLIFKAINKVSKGLLAVSWINDVQIFQGPPRVLWKCKSYTLGEFNMVTGSRLCSAATDSIHMIMSVNFILFLYILHGSLCIKKVVQMSHRMSWTDMICMCYGLHGHFIANTVDFKRIDGMLIQVKSI